jgi:hypothetical protein
MGRRNWREALASPVGKSQAGIRSAVKLTAALDKGSGFWKDKKPVEAI